MTSANYAESEEPEVEIGYIDPPKEFRYHSPIKWRNNFFCARSVSTQTEQTVPSPLLIKGDGATVFFPEPGRNDDFSLSGLPLACSVVGNNGGGPERVSVTNALLNSSDAKQESNFKHSQGVAGHADPECRLDQGAIFSISKTAKPVAIQWELNSSARTTADRMLRPRNSNSNGSERVEYSVSAVKLKRTSSSRSEKGKATKSLNPIASTSTKGVGFSTFGGKVSTVLTGLGGDAAPHVAAQNRSASRGSSQCEKRIISCNEMREGATKLKVNDNSIGLNCLRKTAVVAHVRAGAIPSKSISSSAVCRYKVEPQKEMKSFTRCNSARESKANVRPNVVRAVSASSVNKKISSFGFARPVALGRQVEPKNSLITKGTLQQKTMLKSSSSSGGTTEHSLRLVNKTGSEKPLGSSKLTRTISKT